MSPFDHHNKNLRKIIREQIEKMLNPSRPGVLKENWAKNFAEAGRKNYEALASFAKEKGITFEERDYKYYVRSHVTEILRQENGISEKDFGSYDEIISETKNEFESNPEISRYISECESGSMRHECCGENVYFKFWGNKNIEENNLEEGKKKKSKFQKLQDNKIPLTDEEREKVMKADAIWHHGPNGAPSPAVWKSKDKKTGKITYITNTHRAYNTAPTLKGAISRYHKFIKGTA